MVVVSWWSCGESRQGVAEAVFAGIVVVGAVVVVVAAVAVVERCRVAGWAGGLRRAELLMLQRSGGGS